MPALCAAAVAAALVVSPAPSLSDHLRELGYVRVPITMTKVGHLYADGTVAGHPVKILIDTRASTTVLDTAVAESLGLKLGSSETKGGGMGGSLLAVSRVEGADIRIGTVRLAAGVAAMDFSNIRASLARHEVEPPAVVLGADAMKQLDAVLAYGEGALYLKPPRP
jgi:predicted aspartyl protease